MHLALVGVARFAGLSDCACYAIASEEWVIYYLFITGWD